jgi:integrase
MEDIKSLLKKNRPAVSDSTIKTYSSIVSNLYKKVSGLTSLDGAIEFFEKNPKKVIEYLKDVPSSSRKTTLASLVVLCEKKECADIYRKLMLSDAVKYNDREKDQEKTETQKENWVSQDELKGIYEALDKDTRPLLSKSVLKDPELQRLQNFLILSLYVLQPPRRLQDYTEMKLKNINKEEDNYIDKTKFVFNKYKTAKHHGREEVAINPKLKFILNKWIKLNPHEYMLVSINHSKLSSSQLQQRLNGILGRKASVNILRHSFLSDKYKDIDLRDMEQTAHDLGHSVPQLMNYIKKD